METKVKRPAAVWIAQILILLIGFPVSLIFLISIPGDVVYLFRTGPTAYLVFVLALLFLAKIFIATIFALAFWGLLKGKNYGRWLAFAVLTLLLLVFIYGQIFRPAGPIEYYEYTNNVQVFGAFLTGFFFNGLFGLFLFKLAFGARAKAFFHAERTTPSAEPAATAPS
jgi:hypothetical protein